VNSEAGTINFSGLANIDTSATDTLNAVYLENNDGATILFSELVATDDDDHTVLIDGGGTVQFSNTDDSSTITSTGSGDAVHITEANSTDSSDDPVVSVASAVTNSGTGRAVYVENIDSTSGIAFSGAITDTSGNGSGIELVNNGLYDATVISFTGETTLSTGANSAVTLTNNDDATISFSDLKATAADGDTFVVQGGGTVTVSENDDEDTYINNTGSGDAVRIEGIAAGHAADPTVTIESAITNTDTATGSHAVVVNGVGDGSSGISFSGDVTDIGSFGEGILVQDSSAVTVRFTGTTSLSTGANSAVVLSNNEDATDGVATIRFDDLSATSSSVNGTFLVEGGGTVNVNDTENASVITNSSTGAAVYIDGDNGAGVTGDSTVTIAADIKNSGTGRAVIVEDRTDNDVAFTGEVGNGSGTDGGILVRNVNGGNVAFTESVTVNTSNHTGIQLENNTDGTITFNGMDVTTTNQAGFSATGGGTLAVSDSVNSNTIDTTDGSGVIIDGMEIDSAGVAFDTIDVSNATTVGVQFSNNTGGSISVTGDMDLDTDSATAVEISGNDGAVTLSGDTIDLTGSNGVGIDISGTNTSVSVSADVENSEGTAVRIGGNPTLATISGNITSDTATLLEVNGLTAGTVNVSGDMTHTGSGGQGILVTGNSSGDLNVTGDIDVDTGANNGVTVTGSTNDFSAIFEGDIAISTTNGTGISVTGNANNSSAAFSGDINITASGSGSGVSFSGNTGSFVGSITGSSTNNLTVSTNSGTGIAVGGGGDININGFAGNRNSITTTSGVGIDATNAEDFRATNTNINSGTANAVEVTHNNATASSVSFDGVTVTNGDVGFMITAAGSGELDVVLDQILISGVAQQGLLLDTDAGSNRVDLTLTDSSITAADASAVAAVIDGGSGNVRFLIQGNTLTNNSATDATMDISMTTSAVVSATIGVGQEPASGQVGHRSQQQPVHQQRRRDRVWA
jgi:hypothetical protein